MWDTRIQNTLNVTDMADEVRRAEVTYVSWRNAAIERHPGGTMSAAHRPPGGLQRASHKLLAPLLQLLSCWLKVAKAH